MRAKRKLIDEASAVKALAALAQAQRLRAFRALVMAGPQGLTPGAMAAHLGIAPSALSFHLKELMHAGLASSEPRGRYLIYRASFEQMGRLLAYLTEHCCQGEAVGLQEALHHDMGRSIHEHGRYIEPGMPVQYPPAPAAAT